LKSEIALSAGKSAIAAPTDQRPRVLHLIDHMGIGGAQQVVLGLVEGRDPSHTSVVSLRSHCLPDSSKRMEVHGISYRELGISRRNPLALHRIGRAFHEVCADIVHSHLEFSNELAVLAGRSLGGDRPAVIVHVHNFPDRQYSRLHRWAGRMLASHTDVYIAPSASIAESIRKEFGRGARRVEVIPYGIDPVWFDRGSSHASAARRSSAAPVIGTVARLAHQKSIHDLIEAMPYVLRVRPDARLVIVGDGPLRSDLEALCRRLGLAQSVTFAGISNDVAAAYAAIDVFVLPSRHEGLPVSLLEVMAMGIPVVGTRVPGITELVEDEHTGLAVPYGQPEALAVAVLRLLSDEKLCDRLCRTARERIRHGYASSAVAERIEALYDDLCAGVPRGKIRRS
jgi:glycosyltransferase involved in cell wall biosynthesis